MSVFALIPILLELLILMQFKLFRMLRLLVLQLPFTWCSVLVLIPWLNYCQFSKEYPVSYIILFGLKSHKIAVHSVNGKTTMILITANFYQRSFSLPMKADFDQESFPPKPYGTETLVTFALLVRLIISIFGTLTIKPMVFSIQLNHFQILPPSQASEDGSSQT